MRIPKLKTIAKHHSYFVEIRPVPEPSNYTLSNFGHCLYSGEELFLELRTIYDRIREKIEISYNFLQQSPPEGMVPVSMRFYGHDNPLRKMSWHFTIMQKIEDPLIVLEPEGCDDPEASIVLATGPLMREYEISPGEQTIISPSISVSATFV